MLSGRHGQCERAIHRPQVSIQRQLANEYRPALATALHGTIRNQNADRNGEVEGRPDLRKVGGGEIHNHASLRIGATGRRDRRPDPVGALADRATR